MNKHSSPYASAGYLINEHLEKRRGLKSLAFDTSSSSKKKGGAPDKSTYATVCKTLQHLSIINSILNANNKSLHKKLDFDNIRNKGLLYVMLYELLFGKYKSIRGGGKLKRLICKCEKELRLLAVEFGSDAVVNGGVQFPRYIRVNTLQSSTKDMVDKLKEDLAVKLNEKSNESNSGSQDTSNTTQQIYVDAHVPDLLVLPPTASSWLHRDYEPVKSGKIILQDKSSCFSALVMAQGLGVVGKDSKAIQEEKPFDYIDACAAPGNKTSHLAALINSSLPNIVSPKKKKKKKNNNTKATSTIFAFERDGKRHTILQERMNQLVPTISEGSNKVAVEPIHGDFLRSDPNDPKFANVKAIMLDPSCSGSGIVNSPDRWMEETSTNGDNKKEEKRIQSLSNFQLVALKHSMQFPNVDRIVYSTCSVHDEENEMVVSKALSEIEKPDDEAEEWVLLPPVCLQHWKRRGKEGVGGLSKEQADCLIRCDGLDGDETNGFFVTFLVRRRLLNAQKERREIEDVGIPVYNGEFKVMCKQQSDDITSATATESTSNKESSKPATQSSKKQQPEKKTTPATTNKATENKKSAKKREKKLAWKRKQALLKTERLKKKEAAASKPQAS